MSNIIYHYTSPEGILGILENKTLRFTDCQYLNDKSEFIYIREPFEKAWREICEKHNKEFNISDVNYMINGFIRSPYQIDEIDYDNFIGKVDKNFNELVSANTKTHRYYVLCGSQHKDASNMWNYFIKNGVYQGYNLGIDLSFLTHKFKSICRNNNEIKIFSKEVIYNFEEQVNIIINKMDEIIADKDGRLSKVFVTDEMNLESKIKFGIWEFIHEQKLFFKNAAFENEKEHRFVLRVDNEFSNRDNLSIKFRVGESGVITPFVEWKYTLDEKGELFKQITLAPMIEPELAEESFKRFLAPTVYRNIKIEQSSIKLRF